MTCSSQTQADCTIKCPNFYYNSNDDACKSCSDTFGANCIACTDSKCTHCSYSSNTVLAQDGNSCVSMACSDVNCVQCYTKAGTNYCLTCAKGYSVGSDYNCAASTCSIARCLRCLESTTCSLCADGYSLSSDQLACLPVCSDPQCATCLRP